MIEYIDFNYFKTTINEFDRKLDTFLDRGQFIVCYHDEPAGLA